MLARRVLAVARPPPRALLPCCRARPPRYVSTAADWGLPDADELGSEMGAMAGPTVACNWLVPGRVIVGAYPAAPGNDKVHDEHLGFLLDAGVRLFVMLNGEVPRESGASTPLLRLGASATGL